MAWHSRCSPPVHPRACGEHLIRTPCDFADPGSSPRVRGTRRVTMAQVVGCRFIPARAGNTALPSPPAARKTVHPRACGEHPFRKGCPREEVLVSEEQVKGISTMPCSLHPNGENCLVAQSAVLHGYKRAIKNPRRFGSRVCFGDTHTNVAEILVQTVKRCQAAFCLFKLTTDREPIRTPTPANACRAGREYHAWENRMWASIRRTL